MLVLDTHAFIWAHKGIRIGKKTERRIMAAGARPEPIDAISVPPMGSKSRTR